MVSSHVCCQRCRLRVSRTAVEQRRQRKLQQRLEQHGSPHLLAHFICGRNTSCILYLWQEKASYSSVATWTEFLKKFSNRHRVSMMTVVNGECKSTKIYTSNLLGKGWQHTVCQKLAYKIKQKFYIEGWQIEKMLTGTHNLIPIIYFHFTSLNPSATFQNNGKINSIILESIICPQRFF